MAKKASESTGGHQVAREIIVDSDWAEAMLAKDRLNLSPEQVSQLSEGPTMRLSSDLLEPLFSSAKKRTSPVEWIEPVDAVHLLSPHLGGDAQAKLAIAERLRDGAIACTCVWTSDGPDIGPVSTRRPQVPDDPRPIGYRTWASPMTRGPNKTILGGAFWTFSDDWDRDFEKWNWRDGLFVACRKIVLTDGRAGEQVRDLIGYSAKRMVVSGIRFDRSDIEKIIGTPAYSPHSEVEKKLGAIWSLENVAASKNYRGPELRKFDDIVLMEDLRAQILDGRISQFGKPGVRGTQAKLERYIRLHMTGDDGAEPGERTARLRAQEIMKAWREHISASA